MRQKRNASHLILMELMFVLFFFAICGAILLQVFVKSHNISIKAKELTETKNYVTQAAELFEAGCLKVDEYQEYFEGLEERDGKYQIFFDTNFNMTSEKNAAYQMTIEFDKQKSNITGKITMKKGNKQIYDLKLLRYLQGRKEHEKS